MLGMVMCREATRLMSKRLDTRLRLSEKLSLKFHTSMCSACRRCDRQFELLHRAGERRAEAAAESPEDEADA